MALFRDLSRTIAEVEGLSEMTVTGVGQYLRDAGLISKHGRGRAAAQMTRVDAVNLLIGVNAAALAKDAPETVRVFSGLSKVIEHYPIDDSYAGEDAMTRALYRPVSFGSCLADLLACFIPDASGISVLNEQGMSVTVTFSRPAAHASIWAGYLPENEEDTGETFAHLSFEGVQDALIDLGDKSDQTTISEKTLSAVGRLLSK